MVDNEKSQTKSKEYDIKKWKETFIAQEMSNEERNWYLHWMNDYNERIRKSRNKNR